MLIHALPTLEGRESPRDLKICAFLALDCETYRHCSRIRDTARKRVDHVLEHQNLRSCFIEGGMKVGVKAGGDLSRRRPFLSLLRDWNQPYGSAAPEEGKPLSNKRQSCMFM